MKKVFQILLINLFVVFIISSCTFCLIYFIPGDPVDFILKDSANQQEKNLLRQELGLDQPFYQQYLSFIKNLSVLDLGKSIHSEESVLSLLKENIPFSFALAIFSCLLSLLWGIPLGLFAAHPACKKYDKFFDTFPILFLSVPAFVFGPIFIWLFSVYWPLFPIGGSGSFHHLILPSVSLALPLGAVIMKITRASLLEVMNLDYVRTAKAKGLNFFNIYFQHVLMNALTPIITIVGLQMGALLTGAVIIEIIFDRPGIGSLLYQAIVSRDYPLIQACVLFIALVYIFINRLTDWLYTVVQPQARI